MGINSNQPSRLHNLKALTLVSENFLILSKAKKHRKRMNVLSKYSGIGVS